MGYYSDYELEIRGKGPIFQRLKDTAHDIDAAGVYNRSLEELINNGLSEVKWYSHEEDIAAISKNWPNVMFVLSALGEDGEQWRVYAMNGKSQNVKGRTVFDDPDMSKFDYLDEAEIQAKEERKAELQAMLRKLQAELDSLS
ncbi:hypothetical protein PP459_gp158 [Streptomyces phage Wakanda]|uniref:Uncharacterized protein n=2 Tax=Wakandavirus TaxID=3044854 RepID=A0A6G8R362_9CAUD|nr:hypothetical protein PP459_gp158 [Streptomyces phage Wakanda]YP_010652396.1 hypothetical protein PP460_gp162 [Streptomyces phage Muntaha]QIN94075.1 hypothetical protein SEA_WAKANDA_85 [Streptomyces phage Wakanda]QIN94640.1 hypothetical protein SEA_MUNTAHA_87 [Streptomyces phage Muntaha]